MADAMSLGRLTQLGVETTHGVVPGSGARAQLTDLTFAPDPSFGTIGIRGTGRRFNAATTPDGKEMVVGKVGGGLGYNSFLYPASMIWGADTTSTPTNAVVARQHKWIVALSGSIDPKSFDLEQGDSVDAEQLLNTILSDIGVDITRAACTPSGTLLARALAKATAGTAFTAMTSSGVQAIPIVPVLPKEWSIYMDDTSANVGTTKLTRCFHAGVSYQNAYLPFFPIDAANTSFAGVADNETVAPTMLLELMKDGPNGQGESLWAKARTAQRKYVRMSATSSQFLDNLVLLNGSTGYTAGNVGLTYKGNAVTFAFNALGSAIQTALLTNPAIPAGTVTVSPAGTAFNTNTTFTITFSGALANDPAQITVTTQPTGGTVVATVVQVPYSLTFDVCGSVKLPGPFANNSGLRVRQWDFDITEDPAWGAGQAIVVTLVNSLATLL